jgi:hypothetical protein
MHKILENLTGPTVANCNKKDPAANQIYNSTSLKSGIFAGDIPVSQAL